MKSIRAIIVLISVALFSGQLGRASTPLTMGVTYSGTIATPGQTHQYSFTGSAGQFLYYDALEADSLPMSVSLLTPGGTALTVNSPYFPVNFPVNDDTDRGPFILTESGAYTLVFSGSGATTGNYQFRLLDLSAAPTIAVGSALTNQLSPPLSCNIYQFNGTRGQRILLQNVAHSSNQAQWQLVSPANFLLASGQIYQNPGAVTLPTTGAYYLLVQGIAAGSTPLMFQISLTDVSDASAVSSGLGVPHSGTVNGGQTNSFTFVASAGLPVYFNSLDRSGQSLVVDLIDPFGGNVFTTPVSEIADSGPYVLPRSGTYTLNVRGQSGASGNFSFRLLDLSASPVLSMNTVVSNVLSTAYQTDVYQFAGTAGQRLYYDAIDADIDPVQVRLSSPDGQLLFQGNADQDKGPAALPATGTFYFMVQSQLSSAPLYWFQMLDLGTQPAWPLNTDVTGTLATNTTAIYGLAGIAGEQLYFNGKGVSIVEAYWYLYAPNNTAVAGGVGLQGDFKVTLPYSGNYAVVLVNGAYSVSYTNQINTFGFVTNALTLGVPVTNAIAHPGDQVYYTFNGTAGQRLYFDSLNTNYSQISVTLFSPTGTTIFSGNSVYDSGPFTLVLPGVYTLVFAGSQHTTDLVSFQLLDLSAQPALPLNADFTGTLSPVMSSIYQLTGTVGEQLYFNGKGINNYGATWTLYGPNNAVVAGGNGLQGDFPKVTLPFAGTYALVLANNANLVNSVSFTNQVNTIFFTTNSLTLGVPVTNAIVHPGDQVYYTFNGTPGQRLYFDSLNTNINQISVALVSPTGIPIFSGNSYYDNGPFNLTEAGVYSLVFTGSLHTTDTFSFQLLDVGAQPALPLNSDISGVLAPQTSVIYTLAGSIGEQLYFRGKGVNNPGASWSFYGPNNAYLGSAGLVNDFALTLQNTGNYVLVLVNGANTVGFTNQVSTFAYPTNTLTLSAGVTNSIIHPGDQIYYTFNGTAGQRLYYDSLNTNVNQISVTLVSPTGATVFTQNSYYDYAPFTLTEAGVYTLVFSGSQHTTDTFSFNLLDLALAPVVAPGGSISNSLSTLTQTVMYRLAGVAGQRLSLQSANASGSQAIWELVDPDDQIVGSSASITQNLGTNTLPLTGSYELIVSGSGLNPTPLSYQLSIFDVTDASVTSSGLGVPLSGTVNGGQTNSSSFVANAGLPVYFDSLDNSGQSLVVDLIDPAGVPVFSVNETQDSGPYVLPRSGTYSLNVRGPGGASGNFNFRLLDLSASPVLPLNTPVGSVITVPFQTDVYQFQGAVGQRLLYDALTNDANYPAIYALLSNTDGKSIGPANDFQIDTSVFTLPHSDTYYLFLKSLKSSATGYNFRLLDLSAQPNLPVGLPATNVLAAFMLGTYQYAGVAGQTLYFHALPGNASGSWILYDPNNIGVPGGSSSLVGDFNVTLPWTGLYALTMSTYSGDPATNSFQVNSYAVSTNSYLTGTAITNSINFPGERKYYTFTGTVGQRLIYDALTNSPDYPFYINVQFLNPQGVQEGPVFGRFEYDHPPFTLLESGLYSLVFSGNLQSTGTFSFRLLDVSALPALPVGVTVSNSLPADTLGLYQYAGTAGQTLYFHALPGNASGAWNLYDPDNNGVGGSSLASDFSVTLPFTGVYALVLGTYSGNPATNLFQVNNYSFATNSYTVGSAATNTIGVAGERKYYTFTGTVGQRLIYDALTNSPDSPNSISAQLLNPQGLPEGPISGRFENDHGPFTLQESGPYTLIFNGNGASTGTFSFQLLDLSVMPALPLGVTATNNLRADTLGVYQYTGVAGQNIYFHALPGNASGSWTLYDPNDNSISGNSLTADFAVTLPYTGLYGLLMYTYSGNPATNTFRATLFNDGEVLVFNRAPVLTFIPAKIIAEGSNLAFSVVASDPYGNALTFSLDPGGPAGATINPASGVFAWTPPITGFSLITNVTIRVTDNGSPSLSAAQTVSISVVAFPVMISVQTAPGSATVVWRSALGKQYHLQYKNKSTDAAWTDLGTDLTATDFTTSEVDSTIGTQSQRYYRVRLINPL